MNADIAKSLPNTENKDIRSLITDLRQIIEQARWNVAATANYELTMMYWHIGRRINCDILDNERAVYGQQIVATVSRQLQDEYGSKGFDEKNIRRMMQFASLFTDEKMEMCQNADITHRRCNPHRWCIEIRLVTYRRCKLHPSPLQGERLGEG